MKQNNNKPSDTLPDLNLGTAADLCDQFLQDRHLFRKETLYLLFSGDMFYEYSGSHYKTVKIDEIQRQIVRWLRGNRELRSKATSATVNNIVLHIKARCECFGLTPPSWLNGRSLPSDSCVSMQNGILMLKSNDDVQLIDHTRDYFDICSLPFDWIPKAESPTWERILEEILPDPDKRDSLQEFFGYCLTSDTSYQRFFILVGEGANGKSVILNVLRCLLGTQNVSAVPLEAFDPRRTFPLAAMLGKKANIVEEMGEIRRAGEGILKQLTETGQMTIEDKNKPAFQMTPTVKLIFATNVLPRFVDRSNALWRRMTLIDFNVVVKREHRNNNYTKASWWLESGEMPGILNWAIKGLRRLHARGYFRDPKSSEVAKEDYRRSCNPAKAFLADNCSEESGSEVITTDLYRKFKEYCSDHGVHPLSGSHFSEEVRRVFPSASKSRNPVNRQGQRVRVWFNLKYTGQEEWQCFS